jgi:hypothetical protein
MKLQELSHSEVSEAIAYDPETGSFTWKVDASKNIKKGMVAGSFKNCRHRTSGQIKSYLYIRYKDREMVASRVAWLLHHGVWPERSVMFVDGVTTNLRVSNLKLSNFTTTVISTDGRENRKMAKEVMQNYGLQRYYGMTITQYAELFRAQDGKCAICHQPEMSIDKRGNVKSLAVDHCHKTGSVRELLCYSCNSMLGQARDNIEVLLAGADYIRKHSAGE